MLEKGLFSKFKENFKNPPKPTGIEESMWSPENPENIDKINKRDHALLAKMGKGGYGSLDESDKNTTIHQKPATTPDTDTSTIVEDILITMNKESLLIFSQATKILKRLQTISIDDYTRLAQEIKKTTTNNTTEQLKKMVDDLIEKHKIELE